MPEATVESSMNKYVRKIASWEVKRGIPRKYAVALALVILAILIISPIPPVP
jgi:hypothetical protein